MVTQKRKKGMVHKLAAAIMCATLLMSPMVANAQVVSVSRGDFGSLEANQVLLNPDVSNMEFSTTNPDIKLIENPYNNDGDAIPYGVYYYGRINFGTTFPTSTEAADMGETKIPGAYTIRFKDGAVLDDDTKADVLMTISDWTIYAAKFGAANSTQTEDAKYYAESLKLGWTNRSNVIMAACSSLRTDVTDPSKWTADSTSAGVPTSCANKFRITIKVVKTGTDTPVDKDNCLFTVKDLDVQDNTYRSAPATVADTTEASFERFNGPYTEGVELVSGFKAPLVIAKDTGTANKTNLVNTGTTSGNTRIAGDAERFKERWKATGDPNDPETYYSGFVSAVNPKEFSFYWTGSESGRHFQMGTTMFMQPEVAVVATAGDGGSIEKQGRKTYIWSSATSYDYTPDTGYSVKSLKVDGENVTFNENGGTYTFNKLYRDLFENPEDFTIDVQFAPNPAKVIAHHVDSDGNTIADDDTINGVTDQEYETGPKQIEGYDIAKIPDNAKGTMAPGTTDVTYVYQKKSYEITTEVVNGEISEGGTVKYLDSFDVSFSPKPGYELSGIEVDGTMQDFTGEESDFKFTRINRNHHIKVSYIPADADVIIHYVDESGSQIAADDAITGKTDDPYQTTEKDIKGYTLKEVPDNTSGTMGPETTEVTYVYAMNHYKVETEVVNGTISDGREVEYNDDLTVKYTPKEGYHLVSVTVDSEDADLNEYPQEYPFVGIDADHTVKVVYEASKAEVVVHYVDEDGKPVSENDTIDGKTDDPYSTSAKEIPGYKLSVTPQNAKGTMVQGTTDVTYVYARNAAAPVKQEEEKPEKPDAQDEKSEVQDEKPEAQDEKPEVQETGKATSEETAPVTEEESAKTDTPATTKRASVKSDTPVITKTGSGEGKGSATGKVSSVQTGDVSGKWAAVCAAVLAATGGAIVCLRKKWSKEANQGK